MYKNRVELWPSEAAAVATQEEKDKTLALLMSGPCECVFKQRAGYAPIRFTVCAKCAEISDHLYAILERAKIGGTK